MVLFPFSVIQKQPVTGMAQIINLLQSKRSLGRHQRSIKITSDIFEFATKGPPMYDDPAWLNCIAVAIDE